MIQIKNEQISDNSDKLLDNTKLIGYYTDNQIDQIDLII